MTVTILGLMSNCGDGNVKDQTPVVETSSAENVQITQKVEIRELSAQGDEIRFELINGTTDPIFLAYHAEPEGGEKTSFVPYNLLCRSTDTSEYNSVGPDFHFVPSPSPLEAGQKTTFSAKKPDVSGDCLISVYFTDNAEAAGLVKNKILDLTPAEKDFIYSHNKSTELKFRIG